jgi:hypothetical protein
MLVAVADEQRAEPVGAAHVAAQPADDDELLPLGVLDLDPRAAAAARVVALSSRLARMPSRPCARVAASSSPPSPRW